MVGTSNLDYQIPEMAIELLFRNPAPPKGWLKPYK